MMSYLEDALNETHPGHNIDVDKVNQWFRENNIIVRENYEARWAAEKAAYKANRKAAEQARIDAAPVYTGTTVARCQASVSGGRMAPSRCHKAGRLYLARDPWHKDVVLALCRDHVRKEGSEYNGWGGDPNPRKDRVEPEEAAKVPQEGER